MVLIVLMAWPTTPPPPIQVTATPTPTSAAPDPPAPVMLVYHEQRLRDPQRAAIVRFVAAAVPPRDWKTEHVAKATTFAGLADDYYDLYERGRFSNPRSTAAMIEALRRGNPDLPERIPAGTVVRLPPLPVRAKSIYDVDRGRAEDFRVFSASDHAYVGTSGADALPLPRETSIAIAQDMSAQRDASSTGIVLEVTPELQQAVAQRGVPAVLVSTRRTAEDAQSVKTDARLELLQQGGDDCADAFDFLSKSPFRTAAMGRLSALPSATRAAILGLASRRRFVVLDAQVTRPDGHGHKVHAVARATLEKLGAAEVAKHTQAFDLLPSSEEAAGRLGEALETFLASQQPVSDTEIKRARDWIKEKRAEAAANTWPPVFDMPDMLLQAVLWTNFIVGADAPPGPEEKKEAVWLNMSFRIRSHALNLVLHSFRRGDALAFIAAGNDLGARLDRGFVPQDGALENPNFVLVTHGRLGGIDGTVSGDIGPQVMLVAPGCGFPGMPDRGSSFASPYVAAVAWLRHLVDVATHEQRPLSSLIQDLAVASRPVADYEHVRSGGFFDAAHLLARPPPAHLLLSDGTSVALQGFVVTATCAMAEGSAAQEFKSADPRLADAVSSFSAHKKPDGSFQLWKRRVGRDGVSMVSPACVGQKLLGLSVEVTTPAGQPRKFALTAFAEQVVALTGPTN